LTGLAATVDLIAVFFAGARATLLRVERTGFLAVALFDTEELERREVFARLTAMLTSGERVHSKLIESGQQDKQPTCVSAAKGSRGNTLRSYEIRSSHAACNNPSPR
jgi:hypothetical protein